MKLNLKLLNDRGEYDTMLVEYSEHPPWTTLIDSPVTGKQVVAGTDLFECLVGIRRLVEPAGWRILCNGSRVDAFASNMSRDGSGGALLTLLSIRGRPQTMRDLVFIFDEAAPDVVGTIAQQEEYTRRFFRGQK